MKIEKVEVEKQKIDLLIKEIWLVEFGLKILIKTRKVNQ